MTNAAGRSVAVAMPPGSEAAKPGVVISDGRVGQLYAQQATGSNASRARDTLVAALDGREVKTAAPRVEPEEPSAVFDEKNSKAIAAGFSPQVAVLAARLAESRASERAQFAQQKRLMQLRSNALAAAPGSQPDAGPEGLKWPSAIPSNLAAVPSSKSANSDQRALRADEHMESRDGAGAPAKSSLDKLVDNASYMLENGAKKVDMLRQEGAQIQQMLHDVMAPDFGVRSAAGAKHPQHPPDAAPHVRANPFISGSQAARPFPAGDDVAGSKANLHVPSAPAGGVPISVPAPWVEYQSKPRVQWAPAADPLPPLSGMAAAALPSNVAALARGSTVAGEPVAMAGAGSPTILPSQGTVPIPGTPLRPGQLQGPRPGYGGAGSLPAASQGGVSSMLAPPSQDPRALAGSVPTSPGQPSVASSPSPYIFAVYLDRSSGHPLGAKLDQNSFRINGITPTGLINAWNEANPAMAITEGDYILEVNGTREPELMLDQLKTAQALDLRMSRGSGVHQSPAASQNGDGGQHGAAEAQAQAQTQASAHEAEPEPKGKAKKKGLWPFR